MVRAHGHAFGKYHSFSFDFHPQLTLSQGKLSRAMASQPTHADVFRAANDMCASTITEVENGLASQCESDAAEASRRLEEEKQKAAMAKLMAEREEDEKLERQRKLEQDRLDIQAAEHELTMRKKALHEAEKGPNDGDDDDDNNNNNNNNNSNNNSLSAPDGHMVRRISLWSLHSLLIIMCNASGNDEGQDKAPAGRGCPSEASANDIPSCE